MAAIIDDFTRLMPYLNGQSFNENMCIAYADTAEVGFRNDVLVDLCRNKRVIHIGCCDHVPLIRQKIAQRDWLHGLITSSSAYTIGIDIDQSAVDEASKISGLTNIIAGDITSDRIIKEISSQSFDFALFGEVVEHISNPVNFLNRFRENYGAFFKEIIITVPNAFRGGNLRGALKNRETINSDHRFFFTPYTIAKVALDAGFKPKEVRMASFTRASSVKKLLLNRRPLLAEDIIFIGSHVS